MSIIDKQIDVLILVVRDTSRLTPMMMICRVYITEHIFAYIQTEILYPLCPMNSMQSKRPSRTLAFYNRDEYWSGLFLALQVCLSQRSQLHILNTLGRPKLFVSTTTCAES